MFFFEYASHLNSIQNENILSEYTKSDCHFLQLIIEAAKQQKQLLLYFNEKEEIRKSVCIQSLLKVIERKQKWSTIIVAATSEIVAFNIDEIMIHSALKLNT